MNAKPKKLWQYLHTTYIQFVFAVQNRKSLLRPEWEPELHKIIVINGMPDHLHLFFGFQPIDPMSELIKVVKGESSKWIKVQCLIKSGFRWQEGYGAFSYSRSRIHRVYRYTQNQKKHHKK